VGVVFLSIEAQRKIAKKQEPFGGKILISLLQDSPEILMFGNHGRFLDPGCYKNTVSKFPLRTIIIAA
jgi:hypothetical protein